MDEFEQFYTQDDGNHGIKVPLYRPDNLPTEHWLWVHSVDSDRYKKAVNSQKRHLMDIGTELSAEQKATAIEDSGLTTTASLISAWSFDQPCTLENVKAFLLKAPQIKQQVDLVGVKRELFFGQKQRSLQHSQDPSLNSANAKREAQQQDVNN